MRIIAGTARGRRLRAPKGSSTRPTADRVRQSSFNALESRGMVVDASVLDLFCGSGAMGLEALSRGALRATLVDRDADACTAARDNAVFAGLADRARIVQDDVERWLDRSAAPPQEPFDLVIVDPPYELRDWSGLLGRLAERAGVVVAESGHPFEVAAGWKILRRQSYGATVVTLLEPEATTR